MPLKGHFKIQCKRGHPLSGDNLYVSPSGSRSCKSCRKPKAKSYRDKWNTANPEYYKRNDLKRSYKMTLETFNEMLAKQDGKCAICYQFMKKANVDHNHKCCATRYTCGKCVRALLCDGCNTALGRFKDDKQVLLNAIHYLESYQEL